MGLKSYLSMLRRTCLHFAVYTALLLSPALSAGQSAYFPERALGQDAWETKFKTDWYSKFLTAFNEPSLWEESKNQKQQSYRFLWLRSFHNPVCVWFDAQPDGSALLTVKVGSLKGNYEPGKLNENRTKKVSREQTQWFLNLVEELKFWSLPTNLPKSNEVSADGAQWILEGVKDTKYHVVDRWSPDKGEVHTLGITMLIDLAELKLLYQEVY